MRIKWTYSQGIGRFQGQMGVTVVPRPGSLGGSHRLRLTHEEVLLGRAVLRAVPAQRRAAERRIEEERPILLIGSPTCTPFSNIQNLNKARRDPAVIEDELVRGRMHLAWCCHLYRRQIARGAYFLHEHPAHATSWSEPCVKSLLQLRGVSRVLADWPGG